MRFMQEFGHIGNVFFIFFKSISSILSCIQLACLGYRINKKIPHFCFMQIECSSNFGQSSDSRQTDIFSVISLCKMRTINFKKENKLKNLPISEKQNIQVNLHVQPDQYI